MGRPGLQTLSYFITANTITTTTTWFTKCLCLVRCSGVTALLY